MKKNWIIMVAILLLLVGLAVVMRSGNVLEIGNFRMNYFSSGNYAMGVFAAGTFSIGIFSAGIFSVGIFSIGIFNVGVYALGIFLYAWRKKHLQLEQHEPHEIKSE